MSEFLRVAVSFPAVVWTVLLLISLGFWLLSSVLGVDGSDGVDADVDLSADLGSSLGALATLGLTAAPISVVVTVLSVIGWLLTMLAVLAVGDDLAILLGLLVLIVSFAAALVVTGRVARVLGPLYDPNRGTSHTDLIGRICTVRTGRVDAGFGQAAVTDGDGASHLIQVRCPTANALSGGSRALIIDVDDGVFRIDPDLAGLD